MANAKTINLLLHEGNLKGVITIQDSSWNSGELYSAPRTSVTELLSTDAVAGNKYGVYLLISKDKVYVGQSSDLAKRITQHIAGKDWWENVVILTTSDNRFNHSDIDYLESLLIEKAFKLNSLDCDNKQKGNPTKISIYQKVFLDQYLEEAMFLMELIGITVFSEKKQSIQTCLINTIGVEEKLAIGKLAKSAAIQFLKEKNIFIGKNVTYAVRKDQKEHFEANPKTHMLKKEWDIILNNNVDRELIVLKIPKDTFSLRDNNQSGLYARSDRPELIDLKINLNTLVENRSKLDFSTYVIHRIKY